MRKPHPALEFIFQDHEFLEQSAALADRDAFRHMTSLSLARALGVGLLSRLGQTGGRVKIWDPAVGSGMAGTLLAEALEGVGINVQYRGQDVNDDAVAWAKRTSESLKDADFALGNTLIEDRFPDFSPDLVLVNPPLSMPWKPIQKQVEERHQDGEFRFGLPGLTDSTWLFISLAIEKVGLAEGSHGRVAALVMPSALSRGGAEADVRQKILDTGYLESVTRLPEGLAPGTQVPLVLLTFSAPPRKRDNYKVSIADLQGEFIKERHQRAISISALKELESGLRIRKPGPRNRLVLPSEFVRSEGRLQHTDRAKSEVSWPVTRFRNLPIDEMFVRSRYGSAHGVSISGDVRKIIDLDPAAFFFQTEAKTSNEANLASWPVRRLSTLLTIQPQFLRKSEQVPSEEAIVIPLSETYDATIGLLESPRGQGVFHIDTSVMDSEFFVAWLNSEAGKSARNDALRRAEGPSSRRLPVVDLGTIARYADELIVPVPDAETQAKLNSADITLRTHQETVSADRSQIWEQPEEIDILLDKYKGVSDDSLFPWLDHLPYPMAASIWTAATRTSAAGKQQAYLRAWESIVAFHATTLLSVIRTDPGASRFVEEEIRQVLGRNNLSLDRATFGAWVVILEKIAKDLRGIVNVGEADELARLQRIFGGIGLGVIQRFISTQVIEIFKDVNYKRNTWLGHAGHASDRVLEEQAKQLEMQLLQLRSVLGSFWSHLPLVRAGGLKSTPEGFLQKAELATGTNAPFIEQEFRVGHPMLDGQLYLVRDGAETPLRIGGLIQLRTAPGCLDDVSESGCVTI